MECNTATGGHASNMECLQDVVTQPMQILQPLPESLCGWDTYIQGEADRLTDSIACFMFLYHLSVFSG